MDYCNIDNGSCSFNCLCILKKETSAMKENEEFSFYFENGSAIFMNAHACLFMRIMYFFTGNRVWRSAQCITRH